MLRPFPGSLAKLAQLEEFDASQASFEPPVPGDLKEIHAALDHSVRSAEECISGMSETAALGTWRLEAVKKLFLCGIWPSNLPSHCLRWSYELR